MVLFMPVVSGVQAGGGRKASPLAPAAVSTFLDRSVVRVAGAEACKTPNLTFSNSGDMDRPGRPATSRHMSGALAPCQGKSRYDG